MHFAREAEIAGEYADRYGLYPERDRVGCDMMKPQKSSDTGTRTQVARVKAEYPNQLDYIGICVLA